MKQLEKLFMSKNQIPTNEMKLITGGETRTMNECVSSTNLPQYECGDTRTTRTFDGAVKDWEPSDIILPNECDKENSTPDTPLLA